jgi:hypothetical protein
MEALKIDPEFRDKIPPLTEAEFEQLQENILNDGEVYEPIAVWNGTIVDGHNRWRIIQEHPGLPYRLKQMHFVDKWAAFEWMYKKQLGRRNLTDEQKTYMIGKMYEARKQTVGTNRYTTENKLPQFGEPKKKHGAALAIAEELRVGHNTVERAEKFAKGVEALRAVSKEAAEKVLQGGTGITKATVSELPNSTPSQIEKIAKQVVSGSVIDRIKSREKRKPEQKSNSEYAETRKNFAKIEEVSDILSRNRGNEYTADNAIDELKVLEREFINKVRRVFYIRKDVIAGDKRFERLVFQFADEIENLKEELP